MNKNSVKSIQKHTMIQSLLLHLLPGMVIGLVYFLLVNPVVDKGYPTVMAIIIAAVIVLIPLELGIVWFAKRNHHQETYEEIVLYRTSISFKEYVIWITSIILLAGAVFALTEPLSNFLRDHLFSWIPKEYHVDFGYSDTYEVSKLLITYVTGFVVIAILAPITEEIYFRGYLLPRIPAKETSAGVIHSFLFALYHFMTPWMVITRTIGFYPFVYAVQKKRNIYIVIIGHCVVNMIDFIVGFVFVYSLV